MDTKRVAALTGLVAIIIGVLMSFVYKPFDAGITNLSEWVTENEVLGGGVYGTLNRLVADGLIVETALAEKAHLLITEDLQDGWTIGSMRVWNPFKSAESDTPRPC